MTNSSAETIVVIISWTQDRWRAQESLRPSSSSPLFESLSLWGAICLDSCLKHLEQVTWDFDVCLSPKRRQTVLWRHKATYNASDFTSPLKHLNDTRQCLRTLGIGITSPATRGISIFNWKTAGRNNGIVQGGGGDILPVSKVLYHCVVSLNCIRGLVKSGYELL